MTKEIEKKLKAVYTLTYARFRLIINSIIFLPELENNPKWKGKMYPKLFGKLRRLEGRLKADYVSNPLKFYNRMLEILKDVDYDKRRPSPTKYDLKELSEIEFLKNQLLIEIFDDSDDDKRKELEKELNKDAEKITESIFPRIEKHLKEFIFGEVRKEIERVGGGVVLRLFNYDLAKYEEVSEETNEIEKKTLTDLLIKELKRMEKITDYETYQTAIIRTATENLL